MEVANATTKEKTYFPWEFRNLSGWSAEFAVQFLKIMLFFSPAVPNDLIYEGITTFFLLRCRHGPAR